MSKTKIFLGTPITPLLGSDGLFDKKAMNHLKIILNDLKSCEFDVFCAIEREEWGHALMEGIECTVLDYKGLEESDIFLAFPNSSYGVHMELGWASALQKPIIMVVNEDIGVKTSLVEGLNTVTPSKIIYYKSENEFPSLSQWENELKSKILNALNEMLSEQLVCCEKIS
jgi:nucleoside 2-deoxyribosyltransferase